MDKVVLSVSFLRENVESEELCATNDDILDHIIDEDITDEGNDTDNIGFM